MMLDQDMLIFTLENALKYVKEGKMEEAREATAFAFNLLDEITPAFPVIVVDNIPEDQIKITDGKTMSTILNLGNNK
jgi:hypothetical protein